jgi:hypothetical protein
MNSIGHHQDMTNHLNVKHIMENELIHNYHNKHRFYYRPMYFYTALTIQSLLQCTYDVLEHIIHSSDQK